MAYNHGKEERKWRAWKQAEEKILREHSSDEEFIESLYTEDRAIFNSDRRFYEKLQEVGTYLDDIAECEQRIEICSVADLLDEIENEELYQTLITMDKLTLQIILMKMHGYKAKEIAKVVHLTPDAIYRRMETIRKKLKQFKR